MNKRDFYAPDGYIKVSSYRSWTLNSEYPYLLKISKGWLHPKIYAEVIIWMDKTKSAKFSESRGLTYSNGKRFYDTIEFKTEEDKLIFMLKFSEICDV